MGYKPFASYLQQPYLLREPLLPKFILFNGE